MDSKELQCWPNLFWLCLIRVLSALIRGQIFILVFDQRKSVLSVSSVVRFCCEFVSITPRPARQRRAPSCRPYASTHAGRICRSGAHHWFGQAAAAAD